MLNKVYSDEGLRPPVRGDNPLAKARGLSPRTGGQTMV